MGIGGEGTTQGQLLVGTLGSSRLGRWDIEAIGKKELAEVRAALVALAPFTRWRWASAHADVDITGEGGALATNKVNRWRPAVCGEVLQAEGEAYAEFTWVSCDGLMVGVARAGADPSSLRYGRFATADGWMYFCRDGEYCHNYNNNIIF